MTNSLEEFKPIKAGEVKMYNCGPTVYGPQHIGNLSMYVFTDILRRTLESKGMIVKQVINITDFGHLASDADEGEDKMSKGLRNEKLSPSLENMKILAHKYGELFIQNIKELNIKTEGTVFPYASEYLESQINLIKILDKKSFTYKTRDGIYFDISKFPNYGKLGNLNLGIGKEETRISVNTEKKNQQDFAVWKFNKKLGFPSPWGQGFPGWHIECSAMIIEILGEQIDIHTGGIEHILIHHNNEIAQSESATKKKPFVKYWLHRAHLQILGKKIAKSEGQIVFLEDIIKKGFSPLAYRYFLLMTHYRTSANFSWKALEAADNAYRKLKEFFVNLVRERGKVVETYRKEFEEALENDLNTPEALAVVWKLIKDESVSPVDKRTTLLDFDQVLGLDLEHNEYEVKNIPEDIKKIHKEREIARANKDWKRADELRQASILGGYDISDTDKGQKIRKI